MAAEPIPAFISAIERPAPPLWKYYVLQAIASNIAFPITIVLLYFRYHTMRYRFDDEGIHMRWGILMRHEVMLNYSRIQDIHLRANVVERWLGLARILVQTASGSGSAEMTIEGLKEFEALRDFLYSRMRGVKDHHVAPAPVASPVHAAAGSDELAAALRETAAELRAVRLALEQRKEGSGHV